MSVRQKRTAALGATRIAGATLSSAQLADSPLALWLMQETAGTTMVDATGNGRDGTYTAGVTVNQSGIVGTEPRSVSFSGTTSTASVTYAAWMDVSYYTLECLVYPTNVSSIRGFANRDTGSSAPRIWQWRMNAGQADPIFWNNAGTLYSPGVSGTASTANTAYLMAAVFAAGSYQLYRNGAAWGNSVTTTGTSQVGSYRIQIGQGDNLATGPFIGRMSNFAYYGSALSSAQLLAHAQAAGLA